MTDRKPESSQTAGSWDTYWRGTGDTGAYTAGGASHPAVLAFWTDFFLTMKRDYEHSSMIDLASGNGAVVDQALSVFGNDSLAIHCVDMSEAAIHNIEARFPGVLGTVSDVRSISMESGSFDLVTSQFGVEYAGPEAIVEASRLLAQGGVLALMLHSQASIIHKECTENLDATRRTQESRFIPLAIEMFHAGFDAVKGADRAPYDEAAKQLAPAVQALEEILETYGEGAAGGTIASLYSDVGRIHSRIQHFDSEEVLAWLNRMNEELIAYADRMQSMSESSISKDSFDRICKNLQERGFELLEAGPLVSTGDEVPLAWVLLATR